MSHVRRVRHGTRSGEILLWMLGLGLAIMLTVLFTGDGNQYSAPYAACPRSMYGNSFMGGYQGYESPKAPSYPTAVRPPVAYQEYRQEYTAMTNSLTTPGTSRLQQEQGYQSYSRAYGAYDSYRTRGY